MHLAYTLLTLNFTPHIYVFNFSGIICALNDWNVMAKKFDHVPIRGTYQTTSVSEELRNRLRIPENKSTPLELSQSLKTTTRQPMGIECFYVTEFINSSLSDFHQQFLFIEWSCPQLTAVFTNIKVEHCKHFKEL